MGSRRQRKIVSRVIWVDLEATKGGTPYRAAVLQRMDWWKIVRYLATAALAVVATYSWIGSGPTFGVPLAVAFGFVMSLAIPLAKPKAETKPMPRSATLPCGLFCGWIVASSACFVAFLLGTTGIPGVREFGTSFILVIGTNLSVDLVRMIFRDAR